MKNPKAGKTTKGMRSKQKIFEAAVRLIQERGYEKTTIADICAASEITTGAFYHYFMSKQDILRGVVGKEAEALETYYRSLDKPPYTDAILAVSVFLAQFAMAKGLEFVSRFISIALIHRSEYFDPIETTTTRVLNECFRNGQETGEFRLDFTPAFMTELVNGQILAGITAWCARDAKFDLADYLKQRVNTLLVLLGK